MATTTRIHPDKTPVRIHYIPEWAAKRGMAPADIIRATGADKSLVSRWLNKGTLPKEGYLVQLAELFDLDGDVSALFRDPEDDWIARFYRNRTAKEREKMLRAMLDSVGIAATGTDDLRVRPQDADGFEGTVGQPPAHKGGLSKEAKNRRK